MINDELNKVNIIQSIGITTLSFVLLLSTVTNSRADKTTKNNYYGDWENNGSWVGGVAPDLLNLPSPVEEDYTIEGYINVGDPTTTRNLSFNTNKDDYTITILDTLVVYGNVDFKTDAMNLNIGNGGILIILGDLNLNNKIDISSNGSLIVKGTFDKKGSQGSYSGSGDVYAGSYAGKASELIPDSNEKNVLPELQNDFPDIYDFVTESGNTPLPVELLSFTAKAADNSVVLNWFTASELNNDYFTVEKSRNGKDFDVIAKIEGNGTSHTRIAYSFTDKNPYLGLSYYRLSQTDYDGTTEVFPAISILYTNNKNLSVYPNPIGDHGARIRTTGKPANADLTVRILNIQGQIVFQGKYTTDAFGNLDDEINLESKLNSGTYLLELIAADGTDHIKFLQE